MTLPSPYYADEYVTLFHGDCLDVMPTLDAASVDAIVTDPPYGLGFMGKDWDHGVPGAHFWVEALRVAKPGAHLVAFGGTRTYHRLACAIEDAGWEIRDSIGWSHMAHVFCQCEPLAYSHANASQEVRGVRGVVAPEKPLSDVAESVLFDGMQPVASHLSAKEGSAFEPVPSLCDHVPPARVAAETERGGVLLRELPEPDVRGALSRDRATRPLGVDGAIAAVGTGEDDRGEQPGVEGRSDVLPKARELRADQVCPSASVGVSNGAEGRIHNGASPDDGLGVRLPAQEDGGRASPGSSTRERDQDELGTLAVEWIAQGGGAWPGCLRCGKPLAPPLFQGPLAWNYGSGFPKSHNISKAIDREAGDEREVTRPGVVQRDGYGGDWDTGSSKSRPRHDQPVTDAAKQWDGWGTALKPGWEIIILARKPMRQTVAANVLEHGTGALNIEGCRIGAGGQMTSDHVPGNRSRENYRTGVPTNPREADFGRWPANVVLDEIAARLLDEASGTLTSDSRVAGVRRGLGYHGATGNGATGDGGPAIEGNHGGASRFFYTSKASRAERNAGLDGIAPKQRDEQRDEQRDPDLPGGNNPRNRGARVIANSHPCVKPLDLMQWLCRLVTPKGGLILDPFCGSGSTGRAAVAEGFRFVGIEKEAEYAEIARARIAEYAPLFAQATDG